MPTLVRVNVIALELTSNWRWAFGVNLWCQIDVKLTSTILSLADTHYLVLFNFLIKFGQPQFDKSS